MPAAADPVGNVKTEQAAAETVLINSDGLVSSRKIPLICRNLTRRTSKDTFC